MKKKRLKVKAYCFGKWKNIFLKVKVRAYPPNNKTWGLGRKILKISLDSRNSLLLKEFGGGEITKLIRATNSSDWIKFLYVQCLTSANHKAFIAENAFLVLYIFITGKKCFLKNFIMRLYNILTILF